MTTTLFLVAALATAAPAGPVKDLHNLADYVKKFPKHDFTNYRVLSFSGLEHPHDAETAVRFAVETVNRNTRSSLWLKISDALWAVDTKALGWPREAWDEMSREWPYYSTLLKEAPKTHAELAKRFGTEFPIMRADVFVKQTWEPEWYAKLLRLPATRAELFKEIGLDWPKPEVVAVIANHLSVSKHPRKMARGKTKDGYVVWIGMGYDDVRGKNDSPKHPENFDCDYNEIVIEMPNGLDRYYTCDGHTGKRMAGSAFGEGNLPISTVEDFTETGPQVQLGQSCISCHQAGAKPLAHAARFAELDFSKSSEPHSELFSRYDAELATRRSVEDSSRWTAALWQVTKRTPEQNRKSWRTVLDDYDRDVDLERAAAELGVEPAKLAAKMAQTVDFEKLAGGESIPRQDWENQFPAALLLVR